MEHRGGKAGRQWQLLEPLQLLAYGSAAAEELSRLHLTDDKGRAAVLKDSQGPVLGRGPGTLLPAAKMEVDFL